MCTIERENLKALLRYPNTYNLVTIDKSGSIGRDSRYYKTLEEIKNNIPAEEFLALVEACSKSSYLSEEERIDFAYAFSLLS